MQRIFFYNNNIETKYNTFAKELFHKWDPFPFQII